MNRRGSVVPNTWIVPALITIAFALIIFKFVIPKKFTNANLKNQIILDEKIINTTDEFINYLFENNPDKAGELSLGVVRFNILSNKVDIESDFSIDKINSETSLATDNLAIVNSIVEYVDNTKNEHDVVFYEVKLLKEKDKWKIYHLEEKDPSFVYDKSNDLVSEDKENELKNIFSEYIKKLSEGEYQKASESLIGRAKKMHNKANPALNQLNLVNEVTNLESNIIYQEEKIAISKFNYTNDNRPLSVLVYFYLTEQGWRIYNVNQI